MVDDKSNKLRGLSIHKLYIDEYATLPKEMWQDIYIRRFADKQQMEREEHAKLQEQCDAYSSSDCYEPCEEQVRAKIRTSKSYKNAERRTPPLRSNGRILQQLPAPEPDWKAL